jgi:hypothetical protein
MGLGSLISSAVEAARAATESMQVEVQHEEWLQQDALGKPGYDVPVPRLALVREGRRQIATPDGRATTVKAILTFFPEADGAEVVAIKAQDRVTLPSGVVGIISEIPASLTNPATVSPYTRTVWLV